MSSLTDYTPDVYELVEGWNVTIGASGDSATRTFLETDADLPGSTKVPLPKIGDSFDDDYENLTLKTISVSIFGGNANCGKKYTCNYDSTPFMQISALMSEDELPRSVEIGAEFIVWEPRTWSSTWETDGAPLKQPIHRTVAHMIIKVSRIIHAFDEYTNIVAKAVQKINNDTFLSIPAGMLKFEGATYTEFKNRAGFDRWRVELTFDCRMVTRNFAPNMDGWNFQLREDNGEWDKPLPLLYTSTDFQELYSGNLGDDEDLFNTIPDK